jgi:hypothetical protein
MPDKASYAETTKDWESVLTASRNNGDVLPNIEQFVTVLSDLLTEARHLKNVQEQADGTRQETTQKINETLVKGREAARRLRSAVRAHLGSKSERLPQFGIAPIRRRARKTVIVVPPPEPGKEPTAPTPAPSGSGERVRSGS